MACHPGDDTAEWDTVLAHRPADVRMGVRDRFLEHDVSAKVVFAALVDGGDALHSAAVGGDPDWAAAFGGPVAAALLAAEVSALAAQLNTRASAVRSLAVRELLDDYSAVTVAAHLAVSRQKVYEIGRASTGGPFLDRVPWGEQC